MKYVVTKKQVKEMYDEIVSKWRFYRDDKFTLVLYKNDKNKIEWTFVKDSSNDIENIIYEMEMENYGIFEWVVLKEIGGRRKMNKVEIINGIQWNITNNYKRLAS